MAGNPLVSSAPLETALPAKRPERLVSLISNAPPSQITGLEDFLSVFNTGDVGAEVNPFRFVISRKARRGLGGKFGKGLTTEVVENIVINPNEDLFGLRRWLGAIRSNPASVLLLNVNKIRDDALAAPLVFSIMFKTGRPILVTGVDETMQDQLFAEPDLTFKSIPITLQRNPELTEQLLVRVQRRKGFINSIRSLLDFDFFSPDIRDKIARINAGGDPTELSREEVVNMAVIADLASRYQHVLEQFKSGYAGGTIQMQQLVSMFELLLADLPISQAIEAFKPYLGDEGVAAQQAGTLTSKPALFGYIHKHLNSRDGSTRGSKLDPKAEFARALGSVVIRHRLRVDPFLWKRCAFLGNRAPSEHAVAKSLQPLHGALLQALEANPGQVTSEVKAILGRETFDLLRMATVPQEQVKSENDQRRKRAAMRLLSQLEINGFNPAEVVQDPGKYKELLAGPETFAEFYVKRDIPVRDLRHIVANLEVATSYVEAIAEQVRKSTLDVIQSHAKDRERILRKIYIVKALPELVNFSFFLGDKGLASIERLCGMSILRSRFGLDVHAKPIEFDSIGLFVDPSETPLGKLANEPELLSHAYTEMMALQVETHGKHMIEKKINYYQSTFGENFFEVIYNNVVTEHDLPVSSNQFATIIRERGVLGNLDARGWKNEQDDQIVDPFLTFSRLEAKKGEEGAANPALATFEETFKRHSATFRQMLNELKAFAEGNPDPSDIKPVIWSLFKRGVYNLASVDAREEFRKGPSYKTLKELIAKISSENYSVFAKETDKGVKIFVPRRYHALTLLGNRFAFLVENKVVRYQLLVTPITQPDQMDPVSRVFFENIEQIFGAAGGPPEYRALVQATEDIRRAEQEWRSYSQYLAFALLDRLLNETVIKELLPGKVRAENLFYIPDSKKLCLGPAMVAGQTLPFSKILQAPENNGNIQKNPRSSSTTIDDFAIEVHKIGRVREELESVRGISEDVLDILQNLTHSKGESASVLKYEHNLQLLIRLLSKPIRQVREEDVQALHTVAREIREILRGMYSGVHSNSVANLLQNELQARRSDGHNLKLSYSDGCIIEKAEVKVMQKVTAEDGAVSRKQKKMEVELDATHQTLAMRIREVINTQKLLQAKQHIVFSPEGQKKKQVDYILDIIETLLALRGKAVTFYIDNTMLADTQEQRLATRIKPHNFFEMGLLKPTPAEGMNVVAETDPLSGRTRVLKSGGNGQSPAPPADAAAPPAPTVPAAPSAGKETFFRCSRKAGIEYRLDHESSKYFYNDGGNWVPSRALPVDLGTGATSTILMTRLGTGKLQFHGIIGKEVLLPEAGPAQPPTVCAFAFLDRTVRVVNEGGKAVVRVDKREDSFLDELRSV